MLQVRINNQQTKLGPTLIAMRGVKMVLITLKGGDSVYRTLTFKIQDLSIPFCQIKCVINSHLFSFCRSKFDPFCINQNVSRRTNIEQAKLAGFI